MGQSDRNSEVTVLAGYCPKLHSYGNNGLSQGEHNGEVAVLPRFDFIQSFKLLIQSKVIWHFSVKVNLAFYLSPFLCFCSKLVEAGANLDLQDFDGWTPLHAASHWGQEEACKVLAENLCNMDLKTNNVSMHLHNTGQQNEGMCINIHNYFK